MPQTLRTQSSPSGTRRRSFAGATSIRGAVKSLLLVLVAGLALALGNATPAPEAGIVREGRHREDDRVARAVRCGVSSRPTAHSRRRGVPAPRRRGRQLHQPAPAGAPVAASTAAIARGAKPVLSGRATSL